MRINNVFGVALALAAATTAQSASAQQQGQGHEQHAGQGRRAQGGGRFERLFQGIQLSDAQQQQLRQIFAEGRPQRAQGAARGQRPGQPGESRQRGARPELTAAQRAELQQRRQQMLGRVRGILTAEQRTQFDRNLAQAEARRQQRGGERAGQGAGSRS